MWPPSPRGTWVLDLDGVIWLAGRPIPGADEAVARLRGAGVRVLFATNNSAPTRAQLRRQLAHCGITAPDADLLRSADVAAGLLAPGSSAVVLGDDGIVEALAARGVIVVPEGPADAVVVGLTRTFTYDTVRVAATAVRAGARLVGTNEDATFPTPEGLVPGAGALLAAVATAAERGARGGRQAAPPDGTMRSRGGRRRPSCGRSSGTAPPRTARWRPSSGVPFALVLTGVTPPDRIPADTGAAATARDLRHVGAGGPRRSPLTLPLTGVRCDCGVKSACSQLALRYTLVSWRAMSAYASTSMRGRVLGQVSRGRAEEIVRELVNAGDSSAARHGVGGQTRRSGAGVSREQVLGPGPARGGDAARAGSTARPSSSWPTRWPRS